MTPEERKQKRKEYLKKYHEEYRKKNDRSGYHKEWEQVNKVKRDEYRKKYRKDNKEKITLYANKRYKENEHHRLSIGIRTLIGKSLRRKGFRKNTKTETILGCTTQEFKLYLQSLWEPWMTWENYGLYEKGKYNVGWDIDHIIPVSSGLTEDEILKLNHHTNLQPLCSKVNRDEKRNKGQ